MAAHFRLTRTVALVIIAQALAVTLVELVASGGSTLGVVVAPIWLPCLVGLLAWQRIGHRTLWLMLAGAALSRLPLMGVLGLSPGLAMVDTLTELLLVAAIAPWLRWRLPRSGLGGREVLTLLLPRTLAAAAVAALLQGGGRLWVAPVAAEALPDLWARLLMAHALALVLATAWASVAQPDDSASRRRRGWLLLGGVTCFVVLGQTLAPASWLVAMVLVAWLAMGVDLPGVGKSLFIMAFLPAGLSLMLGASAAPTWADGGLGAIACWSLAGLLCVVLCAESAQREISRSQMATLIHARTQALTAELARRRALEERYRGCPHYDPLTGTPNRALLLDRLAHAIADAHRQKVGLAVCCLDLDGLQVINDACGRSAGDAALIEIASRLRGRLRSSDTVARVGGDEFVVLALRAPTPEAAAEVAFRVMSSFDQALVPEAPNLAVGASLGIALFPQHGEEPETLLRVAEAALQEVKRCGSSGWMLYAGNAVSDTEEEDAAEHIAAEPLRSSR